ncbi:MAG: TetR family transcriptional regulator [Cyclobacteriaceae bacterium]|nr:MAG: TetR family transcriptional regulator [Cyclobacteriaceae bacterium]
MAGRHRTFNEQTVLEKATEVFWSKGYESATTEDLLTAMELNKGSLYNAFGNKKQLFKTVIDHYTAAIFENFSNDIKMNENPLVVLRSFFREVCDPKELTAHMKGCFLGNAVSELASIDGELEQLAINKLNKLEKLFKEALDKAQVQGQLPADMNTGITARYLINIWNGINITRRMYPSKKDLEPILKMSLQMLP